MYLRFTLQGICYGYRVLSFSLSLSPRVFVRCKEAAIASLRHQGIRLANYQDDWLLLEQSRENLLNLGFVINAEKSVLLPTQHSGAVLAPEWLPERVISTMHNARTSSTRPLFVCKWGVFEPWCQKKGHVTF